MADYTVPSSSDPKTLAAAIIAAPAGESSTITIPSSAGDYNVKGQSVSIAWTSGASVGKTVTIETADGKKIVNDQTNSVFSISFSGKDENDHLILNFRIGTQFKNNKTVNISGTTMTFYQKAGASYNYSVFDNQGDAANGAGTYGIVTVTDSTLYFFDDNAGTQSRGFVNDGNGSTVTFIRSVLDTDYIMHNNGTVKTRSNIFEVNDSLVTGRADVYKNSYLSHFQIRSNSRFKIAGDFLENSGVIEIDGSTFSVAGTFSKSSANANAVVRIANSDVSFGTLVNTGAFSVVSSITDTASWSDTMVAAKTTGRLCLDLSALTTPGKIAVKNGSTTEFTSRTVRVMKNDLEIYSGKIFLASGETTAVISGLFSSADLSAYRVYVDGAVDPLDSSKVSFENASSSDVVMNFIERAPPLTFIASPFSSKNSMSRRRVIDETSGNIDSSSCSETNGCF